MDLVRIFRMVVFSLSAFLIILFVSTPNAATRKIVNKAFTVGEKLTFNIRYGPIVAGTATMSIPNIQKKDGYDCYHLISEALSSKTFSLFFKVHDRIDSFMDMEGLFSRYFEKHLQEGTYRSDRSVKYNQDNHTATNEKGMVMPIPPYVQDVLSALYYIRTQNLELGRYILVDNHADDKVYPLKVNILRKEQVKVVAGKFNCFVVEPLLKSTGVFRQKGRLTVWLTDDRRRMPVLMKSKVVIGSIVAELTKYELGVFSNSVKVR